ncbi:LapA family protein [bacterium]|nr:LapA family protein [candidate division CSSED10-310 bacterium]
MKLMKFFLGFIVICLFTLFATANLEKVQINFLLENQPLLGYSRILATPSESNDVVDKAPRKVPLFLVIFASFGLGFIVSWTMSSSIVRSHKQIAKKLKKQSNDLIKERDELRNLPVSASMGDLADNQSAPAAKKNLPVK